MHSPLISQPAHETSYVIPVPVNHFVFLFVFRLTTLTNGAQIPGAGKPVHLTLYVGACLWVLSMQLALLVCHPVTQNVEVAPRFKKKCATLT